jgi:hypothetical protein
MTDNAEKMGRGGVFRKPLQDPEILPFRLI